MKPLYIFRDEQRLGPFDPTDVQRLLNTGQLSRDDPAWTEGLDRWEPLQVVLPKALAGEGDFQLGDPSRETTRTIVEPKARPFLLDVPLALVCPLRGAGPFLLVAATVALVAA